MDKFEGYSQLPRPKLPATSSSFSRFASLKHLRKSFGENEKASIPQENFVSQQTKKRLQQAILMKHADEFMTANLGYLTGTHTAKNNSKFTKACLS